MTSNLPGWTTPPAHTRNPCHGCNGHGYAGPACCTTCHGSGYAPDLDAADSIPSDVLEAAFDALYDRDHG